MKDFPNNEELEQTLASIWKEFAWYLKEVAKKHDEIIIGLKNDVNDLNTKFLLLKQEFENYKFNQKSGLNIIEKVVLFLAFMISTVISILALLK